jgi:hypothetical protein
MSLGEVMPHEWAFLLASCDRLAAQHGKNRIAVPIPRNSSHRALAEDITVVGSHFFLFVA